jgi:hypothetical protein
MNIATLFHDYVMPALSVAGSVVIAASVYVSKTSTPTPGSTRARVYEGIELAALVFGKAKELGAVPPEPVADAIAQGAVAAVAAEAPAR